MSSTSRGNIQLPQTTPDTAAGGRIDRLRAMALLLTVVAVSWLRSRRSASAGANLNGDLHTAVATAAVAGTGMQSGVPASAPPWLHALAGAVGGVISYSVTYPLATIATRLQIQEKQRSASTNSTHSNGNSNDNVNESTPRRTASVDNNSEESAAASTRSVSEDGSSDSDSDTVYYRGATDATMKIIRQEGALALYSGLSAALVGVFVSQGVFYFFYSWLRGIAEKRGQRKITLSTAQNLLLSSLAGAATAILTNPIWVVNTRLQVRRRSLHQDVLPLVREQKTAASAQLAQSMTANQHEQAMQAAEADSSEDYDDTTSKNYRASADTSEPVISVAQVVLEILREEGVHGLFRGLAPALILVANPTIQYAAFERLKAIVMRRRSAGQAALTSLDHFWLGIVAKAIATVITYPYIIAKSVQHTQRNTSGSPVSPGHHSTTAVLARIVQTDGPVGLFRGLKSKIVQSTLTAGILFLTKEEITTRLARLLIR